LTVDLHAHAIEYDAAGWVVIPMVPGTKKAAVKWKEITEPDQARTDRYWQWRPGSSIGVLCGPSDLVVIDVDALGAESALPDLPDTATVTTGRGTHHIYQARPNSNIRNTAGRFPIEGVWVDTPGVDLRGAGGLFVAPPSMHKSGVRYKWDGNTALAYAPWWLRYPEPKRNPEIAYAGTEATAARVAALLNVVAGAPEGQRNSKLNWAAYRMRELVHDGSVTSAEAESMLLNAAISVGLTEAEVFPTVMSGLHVSVVPP